MKTLRLAKSELDIAASMIKAGDTVAFPTDTVYGLGADATNEAAVQKIFNAKGRPSDRPISVLVGSVQSIDKYAMDVPKQAKILANEFWPGPLTIILKDAGFFAASVTAGRKTVGLRMPDNKIALEFIQKCEVPLATPSANTSGRPSPTQSEHVLGDLDGKIAAVIDGGETSYGIESTVLDFSNPDQPIILRPGNISREAIEEVIQQKVFLLEDLTNQDGNQEKHYEPKIPVYIVRSSWEKAIESMQDQKEKVGLLASEETINKNKHLTDITFSLGSKRDIDSANKNLFKGLRELENSTATVILVEPFEEEKLSFAYMNRLQNAANKKTI